MELMDGANINLRHVRWRIKKSVRYKYHQRK